MRLPDCCHAQDFGHGGHAGPAFLCAVVDHGGHAGRDRGRIDRSRIRILLDERANAGRQLEQLEHPDAAAVAGAPAALAAARLVHGLACFEAERVIAWLGRDIGRREVLAYLAAVAELAHQALGDDRAQCRFEQKGLDTKIKQARHRCRGRVGVQRSENKVAGQRGMDGDMSGFGVAHLADHDHVGVLANEGAQRRCKREADRWLDLGLIDPGDLVLDRIVASVVVLPLPVGPVTTIMPCGSWIRRASLARSSVNKPSLSIASRPRSRGSRRMTADSPCCVGMIATRISRSDLAMRSRAAPSCGSRRSAMLRPARILMREITACGSASGGAGTARKSPSMRMRTIRPERDGARWMSLARSSTAFSRSSLTPRTTGAPLARSRRLSMSSSLWACGVSPSTAVAASSSPRRSVRAVAISSNDAISIGIGPPSTISAACTLAVSFGSAMASLISPSVER